MEQKILRDKLSKVLFHGTLMDRAANIVLDGIDFSKLNDRVDFGKGFYMTDSYALAQHTAITRYNQEVMQNRHAYPPVVLRVKISCGNLSQYNIKEFYGEDILWKRFICCNRWYQDIIKVFPDADNNIDSRYDIVIGLTADGKMSNLNRMIKTEGYALSDDFVSQIKPFKTCYTKMINNTLKVFDTKAYQISIHNKNLIKHCIKFKDYDIITRKEDGDYE